MTIRHDVGAASLGLALLLPGAAAHAAPAVQYGGFEIAQPLWPCGLIVNGALGDAALTVDERLSTEGPIQPRALPARVAGNRSVNVGIVCLPTSVAGVTRVLVVAASTDGQTAEAYRNALRADIAARAKGARGQPFRGPAGGTAPTVVIAYGGAETGRHQLIVTPAQATAALQKAGLATDPATSGGEVAGHSGAVDVVVGGNDCPFHCDLLGGVFAVISSSTDAATASLYNNEIQKALLAP